MRLKFMVTVAVLDVILIFSGVASSMQFQDPGSKNGEKAVYEVTYEDLDKFKNANFSTRMSAGELPMSFSFTVERKDNKTIKIIREEKLYNKNSAESTYLIELKDDSRMSLKEHHKKVLDSSSTLIRDYTITYTDPSLRYPSDTIHPTLIPFVMRGGVFKSGAEYKFTTWMNEVNLLKMDVAVKGTETVKVPAGTYECFKVEMKPDVSSIIGNKAFAKVVKPFVPKTTFWFDSKPGHILVKYEGSTSGPGSPKTVHSLKSVQ